MSTSKRVTVGLDVDECVARCVKGMSAAAAKHTGYEISEDDLKHTWDFFDNFPQHPDLRQHVGTAMKAEGFCLGLEVFPGAQTGVKMLQTIADVYFITSPFDSPFWEFERRIWLVRHFGVNRKHVVQTDAKYLVRTDLFVDDKPEHIEKWLAFKDSGQALLWKRPHNAKSGLLGVDSWDGLYDYVRGMKT